MASYSVSDENDLKAKARAITGYADNSDEIPAGDLGTLVEVAQLKVANEADDDSWYSDDGLGQALLYTLCIRMKERAENHSVEAWSFSDNRIQARNASKEDLAQYQNWFEEAKRGLQTSEKLGGKAGIVNTSHYIG